MSSHSQRGLLFIIPWDLHHPGGVNQVVSNLFHQAERSERWHPMVCVNTWESKKPHYMEIDGRPTVRFRLRSPWSDKNPVYSLLAFLFHLPLSLVMLQRVLTKNQIVMVNVHYPTLGALLFFPLRMLGLFKGNLTLSLHGTDIENALSTTGVEHWMWCKLLHTADVITTCSDALKQRVLLLAPKCGYKIKVIHNGLDAQLFESQRDTEYSLNSTLANLPYILCVASFDRIKGHDVLLDAFRLISNEFPHLALVLVGRNGPELKKLKKQVDDFGILSRVLFYENVPHSKVAVFFEQARLFCLPSRSEAFGIVLLEAGLFKLPVVASRVGGIPEIILPDENGILVPPDDAVALANALRTLLNNENEAAMMGNSLHRRVIEHFTWLRAFHEYEAINL